LPQIQVWINNDDPANVEKLVTKLNVAMAGQKEKQLKAFFIFVDDSGAAISPMLTRLAEKTKAQDVCLAYLSPKDAAVKAYKVNLDPGVKNTVMLYRKRRITSKFVNWTANEKNDADLSSAIEELVK
jgi:hypothetical protein